ncbi:MAG: tetratricopeptide repeat protein [Candidatus Sumerlaeaceae bacterium]|nr:tetratricopeptide repeat protein [Candidatus Sumerlaeaceae bacterium]
MAKESDGRPQARRGDQGLQRSAVAAASPPPLDPLRAAAGVRTHDIIPIPVLLGIFAVVWILVVWLMWPAFQRDFTRYRSLKKQREGDYAGAIPLLKSLAAENAENPFYRLEIGRAYLKIGDPESAVKWFTEAQEKRNNIPASEDGKKPPPPDFNTDLGLAYFAKGDLVNAEKHLKLGMEHDRLDPRARFALGELEFKRGAYRKAVEHFKVVANNPEYRAKVLDYYTRLETEMFKDLAELPATSPETGANTTATEATTSAP